MSDAALACDQLLATTRPPQPYPGLRPFEREEWSLFFGRERMIDDVIELLARQRLVVVHGSSGSGKSSLIRAGVLPRLARQHLRHGVPWRTAAMRPSGGPLWNLAAALASIEGRQGELARIDTLRRAFDLPSAHLRDVVAKELGFAEQHLCILVDQFEELFRYAQEISRDESQLFIELLAGLIEDQGSPRVHAVVTMRSEFLGECAQYEGLAEAINRSQYLLPRMDRDGLLRAIRRPAELYGGMVDADLAERLIVDAGGGQDELPLIQHALMLLWNQASEQAGGRPPRLGHELYRQQEGGAAALLSEHADRVMLAVAPDPLQQVVVERLFRALTDINAEGLGIRRPQRFDRLVAVTGGDRDILRRIIEAFRAVGVSFLTPYPPAPIDDGTVIDISHEALIRCWRRLADAKEGWLQREFQDGLIWRSLLAPAESFEKDPQHVLSPALTQDRGRWLVGRPPAWCERHGGDWQRVSELMQASEAAAARARRRETWRRRVSWAPLVVVAGVGLWMAADRGWTAWQDWQRDEAWREAATAAAAGKASPPPEAPPLKDCQECPGMVVLPPGTYPMGSADSGDFNAEKDEKPQHEVTIAEPFAIGRYEVTKAEYAAFVEATYPRGKGCYTWTGREFRFNADADWREPGYAQSARDPVACMSWIDAQEYVQWLSRKTGKPYRLATEAEWEYAARAITTTRYSSGDTITEEDANFGGKRGGTAPVGSYPANAWGLYDMHGNVWEWTEDCYVNNYASVPRDGSAMVEEACKSRVVRGGSWNHLPGFLRSALRFWFEPVLRFNFLGFRVSRTLP